MSKNCLHSSSPVVIKCFKPVNFLSPRYTKPKLQAEKNQAHHKHKKNIAMTDCMVILKTFRHRYFFFFYGELVFFSACSLGLVYLVLYSLNQRPFFRFLNYLSFLLSMVIFAILSKTISPVLICPPLTPIRYIRIGFT